MAATGALPTELYHHSPHVSSQRHTALQAVFDKYASVTKEGDTSSRYMKREDFLTALFPHGLEQVLRETGLSAHHFNVLFQVADTTQRGLVSWTEFFTFQELLTRPFAEYEIAFRSLVPQGRGLMSVDHFRALLQATAAQLSAGFQPSPDWLRLYFGTDSKTGALQGDVDYTTFSEMIQELQIQRLQHGFRTHDLKGTGAISPEAFAELVRTFADIHLSSYVIDRLPALLSQVRPASEFTYPVLRAIYQLVRRSDWVDSLLARTAHEHHKGLITPEGFNHTMAKCHNSASLLTPLETQVLFQLVTVLNIGTQEAVRGFQLEDFRRLFDPAWQGPGVPETLPPTATTTDVTGDLTPAVTVEDTQPVSKIGTQWYSWLMRAVKPVYMFSLGAVAGAVGATAVYPIDLVKTRMQNQRSAVVGEVLYKNSIDCFRKVIRNEGPIGLYRGLAPQLVGVAPEKAIKLTMNDLVRRLAQDPHTGDIALWAEVLAGCTAGGSQVIFTNPLEIVKIRLQVQGELLKSVNVVPRQSAISIVRQLGLVGLYKGAGACLLRDIPFSAIYFPVYAHLKKDVFGEAPGVKLSIGQLLLAGAIAGMPAAYLTTPADVIKTRLQVEVRKGQTAYHGIIDSTRKIYAEEGFRAFFKGGLARVFRSSPQFGTTLMVYEILQTYFPFPGSTSVIPPLVTGGTTPVTPGLTKPLAKVSGLLQRPRELTDLTALASIKAGNAAKLIHDVNYTFGTLNRQSTV
ncbi:mitochondrial aspartate-glutamate transporter agc1 [Dispira simplex]|nr:mitochondrial aspartate-glutamate transporter agc1 [Dispira simplex]